MLAVMRDSQVPLEDRIDMAAAAAPFVHVRPDPVRRERPDPLDPDNRTGDHPDPGDLKFISLDAKTNGGEGEGLSPLDFLLGAMADPAASARERLKAAKVAARYKHAFGERAKVPNTIVVEDKFGFKVDAELARAERDDRLREHRLGQFRPRTAEGIAAKGQLEQIAKRREERLARLKFPDGYTYGDRQVDEKRLGELYAKRLSRKRLTPEEEAEEAHLAVRVLNPEATKPPVVTIPSSFDKYKMEWPMTRMVELEERVIAGVSDPAEEEELRQLRSHHPEIAADVDRLDNLYNYWVRQEREKAEKSGSAWMDARDSAHWMDARDAAHWMDARNAAQEKCKGLRDPRKMLNLQELREGPRRRILELETFRFDEVLTTEEADELEDLHRRYPENAAKAKNMVVRRLSATDYGPIKNGEWPRIWTLPADDARSRTPRPSSPDR
jgi:hypothetical protein